jgi:hypothetical protein
VFIFNGSISEARLLSELEFHESREHLGHRSVEVGQSRGHYLDKVLLTLAHFYIKSCDRDVHGSYEL